MCEYAEPVSKKQTVRTEHTEEKKLLDARALITADDTLVSQSRLISTMQNHSGMSAWITDYKIPDEKTLEEKYDESRGVAFGGLQVIDSHKSKRKSAYMEKAKTQTVASHITRDELETRAKARKVFLEGNPDIEVAEEDVAFLQDWSAFLYTDEHDTSQFSVLSDILSEDESKQKSAAETVANRILELDLSVFDYKDNTEFLRNIGDGDLYRKLCAMSDADKIIGILDKGLADARLIKLKSRIQALKDIREDYENRLTILQSPYYAILLSSDQKSDEFQLLSNEMKDTPALAAYFKAVQDRPALRYGKGKSAKELEKGYLSEDEGYKKIEKHENLARDLHAFSEVSDKKSIQTPIDEVMRLLKEQIPSEPEEQKAKAQQIRKQYSSAREVLEGYVDGLRSAKELSKEQKAELQKAEPLLEEFLDEQQAFLEAEDMIISGELSALTGTWINALLSVDEKKVFTGPTVEDSLMRQEHFSLEEAEQELLASEVKHGFITSKDSPAMIAVKDAISALNARISIPVGTGDIMTEKKELLNAYQSVIDRCQEYQHIINSSLFKGHSDIGKRRYELAGQIIEKIEHEMTTLDKMTLRELGVEKMPANSTWAVIMYNVRAMQVKADDPNVTVVGAGTSVIYRVSAEDGSTSYVKIADKIFEGMRDVPTTVAGFKIGNDEKRIRMADGLLGIFRGDAEKASLLQEHLQYIAEEYEKMRTTEIAWEEGVSEEDYKKTVKETIRKKLEAHIGAVGKSYEQPLQDLIFSDFETFVDFAEYYYKKANEFDNANDAAGIAEGSYISDRNVSTSRLAERLGVADLVAGSRSIMMMNGSEMSRANEMEGVETKSLAELDKYCKHFHITLKYSPEVIRQLSTLQVFDQICGQVDRHRANYNVFYDDSVPGEITVTSLKGVDNDLAFGSLMARDIQEKKGQLRGLVVGGKITVPFIDKKFYEALVTLDMPAIEMIAAEQADLRSEEEQKALKDRLIGVRAHLIALVQGGFTTLVDSAAGWSSAMETMKTMDKNGLLGNGYVKGHGLLE